MLNETRLSSSTLFVYSKQNPLPTQSVKMNGISILSNEENVRLEAKLSVFVDDVQLVVSSEQSNIEPFYMDQ